jgi:hypothetical protein
MSIMSRQVQTAVAALVAVLSMAVPAHAAEAMRVVRDPQTGELRGPTAAEAAAFQKAEAQLRAQRGKAEAKAPVEIRYPDGTVETKLGEDTMMYSVVASAPDGTLSFDCLPKKAAQQFIKASRKPLASSKPAAKVAHAHE